MVGDYLQIDMRMAQTMDTGLGGAVCGETRFAGLCQVLNGPYGYNRSMANAAAVLESVHPGQNTPSSAVRAGLRRAPRSTLPTAR